MTAESIAADLRNAHATRTAIAPLHATLNPSDETLAYTIQSINTQHWISQGRRLVGRKIGLTAKSVQQQIGVNQPDFGALFADMAYGDDEEIPLTRFIQPKIESEVALVLRRDITMEKPTLANVLSAIDYVLPALEIVDSRIVDWKIKFLDTVADNASSGAFVLGGRPTRIDAVDLRDVRMRLCCDGIEASTGSGAACLGHPLNAAVWLAAKMVQMGVPLSAGDIILTGALAPMSVVRAGNAFEAQLSGLGSVRARFSRD